MSRSFYINNPTPDKVLKIGDLLKIAPDFIQYEFYEDDADYQEFINMCLHEFGSVLFGQEGISCRGFEVSYDDENHAYGVRFFTPCAKADWLGGFKFIKHLATHLAVNQVVDEEGETYPADNISYEYWEDIAFGVNYYKEQRESFVFGVNRPVALNEEITEKLLSAADKATAFSEFLHQQQYPEGDPYFAKQMFAQTQDDEIIGFYSLTQTCDTILPYEFPPFIDITKFSLEQKDIAQWRIAFVIIDGDKNDDNAYKSVGELDYQTFLERLPQEKIQKLDGYYMRICLSEISDFEKLLGEKITLKKKGFLDKIKGFFG